jgi:hypothetical protein
MKPTGKPKKPLNEKILYVEKRQKEGDFAARLGTSKRASATGATQAEAAANAKAMHPNATVLGARVRNTADGKPDQWRRLYPTAPKSPSKKKR